MSAGTQIALDKIGQIAIVVKDVARATAFYREKLGMRHLFSTGALSFFDCGGIRLMLSLPEEAQSANSILYFKVAEIHEAHRQMSARGVAFVDQPHLIAKLPDHDLWMVHFRDSEDNLLSMMSEIRTTQP